MAAAYAFHVSQNHPFIDGNKRAAFAAMVAFLTINDWKLDATEVDAERTILELAAGQLDKAQLSEWIVMNSHEKPSLELREFFRALTFEQLKDTIESTGLSPSVDEYAASRIEAKRAMPILEHLELLARHARSVQNDTGCARMNQLSNMFQFLYRAAEDMGYEW